MYFSVIAVNAETGETEVMEKSDFLKVQITMKRIQYLISNCLVVLDKHSQKNVDVFLFFYPSTATVHLKL